MIWGFEEENHVTGSRDEKTDTTIEFVTDYPIKLYFSPKSAMVVVKNEPFRFGVSSQNIT